MTTSTPAAPPAPTTRAGDPDATRTRALVAAAVLVVGSVLGVVAKVAFFGWSGVALLMWWPVTVVLPVAAVATVLRPLVGLGTVRSHLGHAPRRYRVLGWGLGLGVLLGYGGVGDDVEDEQVTSGLAFLLGSVPDWLHALAVAVLVVTLAACAAALVVYTVDRVRVGRAAAHEV